MIEETISRIEERLRAADLTVEQRAELEQLVSQLRREAGSLPREAFPRDVNATEEDLRGTVSKLEESLTSFETSHPQLVAVVNRISTFLANMGI